MYTIHAKHNVPAALGILKSASEMSSDRRTTLQVLLNLCRILAVESFQLLVELHVPLVDVIDVGIFIEWPTATILRSLWYSENTTNTNSKDYKAVQWQRLDSWWDKSHQDQMRPVGLDSSAAVVPEIKAKFESFLTFKFGLYLWNNSSKI